MYKLASKLRLRFNSQRGPLSAEQLWNLSAPELDAMAVALEAEYKASGKKSFLTKKSKKDKEIKLKFDIVLDVLNTKLEESDQLADAREVRAHNAKIDALIVDKQDEELKGKSIADLERMRK